MNGWMGAWVRGGTTAGSPLEGRLGGDSIYSESRNQEGPRYLCECALGKTAAGCCGQKGNTQEWKVQKTGKAPFITRKAKARDSNWNKKPVSTTQTEKAVNGKHFTHIFICVTPASQLQIVSDHRHG